MSGPHRLMATSTGLCKDVCVKIGAIVLISWKQRVAVAFTLFSVVWVTGCDKKPDASANAKGPPSTAKVSATTEGTEAPQAKVSTEQALKALLPPDGPGLIRVFPGVTWTTTERDAKSKLRGKEGIDPDLGVEFMGKAAAGFGVSCTFESADVDGEGALSSCEIAPARDVSATLRTMWGKEALLVAAQGDFPERAFWFNKTNRVRAALEVKTGLIILDRYSPWDVLTSNEGFLATALGSTPQQLTRWGTPSKGGVTLLPFGTSTDPSHASLTKDADGKVKWVLLDVKETKGLLPTDIVQELKGRGAGVGVTDNAMTISLRQSEGGWNKTGGPDKGDPSKIPLVELNRLGAGAVSFELKKLVLERQGILHVAAPKGWRAREEAFEPPESSKLGEETDFYPTIDCAGTCAPKDWKAAAEKAQLARYRGKAFDVVTDKPLTNPKGHLLVVTSKGSTKKAHVVAVRWKEGADGYMVCTATMDGAKALAMRQALALACESVIPSFLL